MKRFIVIGAAIFAFATLSPLPATAMHLGAALPTVSHTDADTLQVRWWPRRHHRHYGWSRGHHYGWSHHRHRRWI